MCDYKERTRSFKDEFSTSFYENNISSSSIDLKDLDDTAPPPPPPPPRPPFFFILVIHWGSWDYLYL